MKRKDTEKKLKEAAENIKMKDFSERWEVIKDKIQPSEQSVRGEVLCEQKVAESNVGNHTIIDGNKKKFLFCAGLFVLLVAVCLAIVLPLTLRKNQQERFLALSDLNSEAVSRIQFEDILENSDMHVIDFSKYELSDCFIYSAEDEKVMGGGVDIIDLEYNCLIKLKFYSSNVTSQFKIVKDYETYNVNNTSIKYITTLTDENYTTVAIADSGKVKYELNCITTDDNVTIVFDRLFGTN